MIELLRAIAFITGCLSMVLSSSLPPSVREEVCRHRNLGKAYYENPMTQLKAVDEFRQALALAPDSTRDRVNYGLALLRAGKPAEAIAELVKAQKADPSIPHTWFNLGMAYKKEFDHQHAIEQFTGMLKLVPNEPVTHYNLGIEYKLTEKAVLALAEFEAAGQLNPNFAAPHFQLYNAYRERGRKEEAARELGIFNEIKKRKAGAAIAEDPEWSYYSEIYDVVELDQEFDNSSSAFTFQAKTVASGIDPASSGMAVLDLEGNGNPDLIVWSDNGVVLLKNGITPVSNTGLESVRDVVSIAPADFNNDGLPDLAVITHSGASLYVNRGGRFELLSAALLSGHFTRAIWMDYDHDYSLDLFLLGDRSVLLRNNGSAGFSDQTPQFPFVAGRVVAATVFDLFPDNNETDLAALYEDGSVVIYHDRLLGHFVPEQQTATVAGGTSLLAADINNDGWTDLIAMGSVGAKLFINDHGSLKDASLPATGKGTIALADLANRSLRDLVMNDKVYRNVGLGKFELARAETLPTSVAMAQADFDNDGRVDLALVTEDGSVRLLKNSTPTSNRSTRVRLEGVKNLKMPLHSIVEVKSGAWYQKQIYEGVPLLFGLRDYSEVDTVRVTWPNGMVQNETRQPAGALASFKEKPRLSGSCPMIFAWNGAHFQFITDVLGVAPLGASSGNGDYFPVNHREHILIPEGALKTRNHSYEIRITEELREVTYLDKVQFIAIDHPAGSEVFTNDKFKGPPFPRFRLYGVEEKIYPRKAVDQNGKDVLPRLVKRDGSYVDTFHRNAAGTAELHALELDFGNVDVRNRAILVLSGWVDWADGSTFLAASHESSQGLIFPYLQVKDSAGQWRTVIEDMGIPSGKPKSIVVDLTGKFLSRSRAVRIVTNLCVYWDEIFLSDAAAHPTFKMTTLRLDSADLHYRGFSTPTIDPSRKEPEHFDYERWSSVSGWNPTPGLYTRYGDVRSLLKLADDRLVIMGSGDELSMTFSETALPPLDSGWKRDFLLLVDGWAKDADSNTAFARSVLPLPFHAMKSYPYPASQHFPEDERHRRDQEIYNTRPAVDDLAPLHP